MKKWDIRFTKNGVAARNTIEADSLTAVLIKQAKLWNLVDFNFHAGVYEKFHDSEGATYEILSLGKVD